MGFVRGLLIGALVTASVTMLMAPHSGPDVRKRMGRKTAHLLRRVRPRTSQ
jgi:gas vesicle protein